MYLDELGKEQPIVMGSYGIGPARIAAAAIEQNADADGIVWPASIAPFQVHVVVVSLRDAAQVAAAEEIYGACNAAGLDALLDDRDERPGVKFKDADLLGMPVRVTVGNALAKEGVVEIKERRSPRRESRAAPAQVLETLRSLEVLRSPA
jgi:prolyl-tRNA synthetase